MMKWLSLSKASFGPVIEQDPEITVVALVTKMGRSRRTVKRTLAELKTAGRLVRKGSARSGWWESTAS